MTNQITKPNHSIYAKVLQELDGELNMYCDYIKSLMDKHFAYKIVSVTYSEDIEDFVIQFCPKYQVIYQVTLTESISDISKDFMHYYKLTR